MNEKLSIRLKVRILVLQLLFLGSFFLIGTERVWAYTIENYQENVEDRFVISPVNLELTLAPGESTMQNIIIVNRLGKTADFQITKEDFVGSQDPEKATAFLGGESAGITTAKDWIATDIDSIALNHGDRLNMQVKITAPQDAVAGSHYAAIFASVSGGESTAGNARVKLVSRVGTLILINVPGNNRESGGITDFSSGKKYYRQGPVDFSTTFENSGNVYEKVKGEIAIRNILGTEIAHVPLKDWTVLSNSSRIQTASWDRKWIMGRYTATLTVFYGLGGNLKDTREIIFYAFPWHVALLILLILIVIYYLLKYFFSKFEIKKKEEKEK